MSTVRVKNESGLEQESTCGTDVGLPAFTGFEKRGDGVEWHSGKWGRKRSREVQYDCLRH